MMSVFCIDYFMVNGFLLLSVTFLCFIVIYAIYSQLFFHASN